ncbi:hypothetical protein [Rhizobium glycinendophyticum]|uniref:Uncharacterized protein n=1 Tax=Rhizobium glycinendophyticum TaxID=2589807 RepID=A0A504UPH9_9HYPH|nr:hypothetical protein [Rhizobium glycinendophyticum]TPP06963.1 hypothetical protein FJQ55_14940 [Rhizobium glycinendophyticum]
MVPLSEPTDLHNVLLLAKVIVMAFAVHPWLLCWWKFSDAFTELFSPRIDLLSPPKQMEAPLNMGDSIRGLLISGVLVIIGFFGFLGMIADVLFALGIRP